MFFYGTEWFVIRTLVVVALVVVVWRQNRRLKAAEFELAGLRDLFLSMRSRLEEDLATETGGRGNSSERCGASHAGIGGTGRGGPSRDPGRGARKGEPVGRGRCAARCANRERALEFAVAGAVDPGRAESKPDIETALGSRWAVWVGGLALALGGAFLVRYTIEAGLLGPVARLMLGGLFGLALIAAGEFIRRTGFVVKAAGNSAAYLPAILTAVGAFTLFAVIYAAHGIYGFIGPAAAFALLAAVALATMAAALVHGQALAGVGLVGAYATPLLVASNAPNAWALFIEVAVALAGAAFIARLRRWQPLMLAAVIGAGLWLLVYLGDGAFDGGLPAAFMGVAMIAAVALLWMRGRKAAGEARLAGVADPAGIAVALLAGIAGLALSTDGDLLASGGALAATIILIALVAAAHLRADATALLVAAALAVFVFAARTVLGDESSLLLFLRGPEVRVSFIQTVGRTDFLTLAVPVGALLLAGGLWAVRRFAAAPLRGMIWGASAGIPPVALATASWLAFGNPEIDLLHAGLLVVLAGLLATAGEWTGRDERAAGGPAQAALWTGAALALLAAIHAGAGPAATTMLVAAAAVAIAILWIRRPVAILTWIAAGYCVVLLGRMAFDPTLIGADRLGTTPLFNYLLAGYGLPALAFAAVAWALKGTPRGSPELLAQGMTAVLGLVGAGMLVRHAMNGGVLDATEPQLAEVAIDSLIAIGGGAVLVALDRRAPSPVFRFGSMALGAVSVVSVLVGHLLALNPLTTNASIGPWPVVDLLLLAYLLPGVALGLLALFARPYRPLWWVRTLTAAGALLVFAWATLGVRRIFKGEFIGAWKGLEPLETWSYSALWLALGVLLLVLGLRFNSLVLRFGSAALVVLAVAKVFLFDMAELEGPLRAFSFIALGLVLIGIGLFYQRMLTRKTG